MAAGPGGTAAPATVSLTVGTPPAPTAGDKSGVAVAYGTATPIDLSGSITGAPTSIAVTAAPGPGTASVAGDVVKIGRAACRERVCQNVSISVVAVSFKKKKIKYNNILHEYSEIKTTD